MSERGASAWVRFARKLLQPGREYAPVDPSHHAGKPFLRRERGACEACRVPESARLGRHSPSLHFVRASVEAMIENLPTRLLGTGELDDSSLRDALDVFIQQGLRSAAGKERRSTDGVEYVRWIEREEGRARLCGKIWELASGDEDALRTFWLDVSRETPDGQARWTLYYGVDPAVTSARFVRDAADLLTSPSDVPWLAVVSGSLVGSSDAPWK